MQKQHDFTTAPWH